MAEMRLLVTGSREYRNWKAFQAALDEIHTATPVTLLIHGGAAGADSMGALWAEQHEVSCLRVPAKWSLSGKAAGSLRNTEMLGWSPDFYAAFPTPDSIGTYDMIRKLDAAGIKGRTYE